MQACNETQHAVLAVVVARMMFVVVRDVGTGVHVGQRAAAVRAGRASRGCCCAGETVLQLSMHALAICVQGHAVIIGLLCMRVNTRTCMVACKPMLALTHERACIHMCICDSAACILTIIFIVRNLHAVWFSCS